VKRRPILGDGGGIGAFFARGSFFCHGYSSCIFLCTVKNMERTYVRRFPPVHRAPPSRRILGEVARVGYLIVAANHSQPPVVDNSIPDGNLGKTGDLPFQQP
ncbi:MAG: hypothetical protein LIP77_03955, partial [Planctomycetes bacterium]|nr:hypothetical protein [Planctomycetota bacterium]